METAFTVVQIILLIVFGCFLSYLALLSTLARWIRRKGTAGSVPSQRIAVIVPAHNEESVIERTVKSILAVGYPRSLFKVIVVADNCSDATAAIARSVGAVVLERNDPDQRGKGYALQWSFNHVLRHNPSFDAIVVVDADSVISEDFLDVMNSYLENGAKAIQANVMAEAQPDSWSAEVTRLGTTLYNYVRPLGRKALGCSAGLRGLGMCFHCDTLRRVPWQAYSLTEDLQYSLNLLLDDIPVSFAPEAKVLTSLPSNSRNAESQRTRWEAGRLPVVKAYAGKLFLGAVRRKSLKLFDAFIELIMPAFVNMILFVLSLGIMNMILMSLGWSVAEDFALAWFVLLGVGMIHVMVGLQAANADPLLYRALANIPRFAAWKLKLYTKLLFRRNTGEWIRTVRDHRTG